MSGNNTKTMSTDNSSNYQNESNITPDTTDRNINHSSSQLASTDGINIQSIVAQQLSSYIEELKSSKQERRIHGTMCIRILLSKADNEPPYEQIIASGVVPLLLQFFRYDQNQKLQFEAAWAVTNLCSSSRKVIDYLCKQCNTIQAFEHLLKTTKHFEIMEQAVWGLGNIAGESQEYRNVILRNGIFHFLLKNVEKFLKMKNYSLCRNAVWCLSNLLRYDGVATSSKTQPKLPPPDLCPWLQIKAMVPTFTNLLNEIGGKIQKLKIQINAGLLQPTDPEYQQCLQCCSDCLWTIHYTQEPYIDFEPASTYLADIFSTNLIQLIILFMHMDSVLLLSPSLRIIGTFVSGADEITQKILDRGYLKAAMKNLSCKVRMIRKEVCWTLSNIAGCEYDIAIQIIKYENGQLLQELISACLYDDDQVKKEAGWVLANLISLSDAEIIHFMVQKRVIDALRAVMKTSSVKKPLITCMEAFDVIMSHSRARDKGPYDYISKVEQAGCVEIFDILQAGVDDNDKVFTTSYELCCKYWPDDGEPWQPPQMELNIEDAMGADATDVTLECMPHAEVENAQQMNGNGNVQNGNHAENDNNGDEEDDDDDDIQPSMNGNQFAFGVSTSNNENNENGNNNNSNGQPFQF